MATIIKTITEAQLPESMQAYLAMLALQERHGTRDAYAVHLRCFAAWLQGRDALNLTTADLQAFQRYLAEDFRSRGRPLARFTQGARLACVKAFYAWQQRQGQCASNPAAGLRIDYGPARRTVRADPLSLQEATALLQTQAAAVTACSPGSITWARTLRGLAVLSLAIASGRRREALRTARLADIDLERGEWRCEREKAQVGRVVPLAPWAVTVLRGYITTARPLICRRRPDNPWLFPGAHGDPVTVSFCRELVARAVRETAAANPDLEDLPAKRISTHSLRVTFASLLFAGGCPIRSINELMLHTHLSTTAAYTPLAVEDLRQVCRQAHPRP